MVLELPLQVTVIINTNGNIVDTVEQRRGITYNLVASVREGLDGGKFVVTLEDDGKLLSRRTEDAVVDDIFTSRWARHRDDLVRSE